MGCPRSSPSSGRSNRGQGPGDGNVAHPRVDRFDDPARLDAFLDAVRWGAITSADSRALQAPFRSRHHDRGLPARPGRAGAADAAGQPADRRRRRPGQDDRGRAWSSRSCCSATARAPSSSCARRRSRSSGRTRCATSSASSSGSSTADMLRELRRARGLQANPWTHFPRLIVSIDWLKRRTADAPAARRPAGRCRTRIPRRSTCSSSTRSTTCAPAGRGKYALDSQRTEAIRTLAPHFEHRLFLSATPHNGYTEIFTALLELLDPQRFARGVSPRADALARVMVRRLKSELRDELGPNPDGTPRFAKRVIVPLEVDYPEDERQRPPEAVPLRRAAQQARGVEHGKDISRVRHACCSRSACFRRRRRLRTRSTSTSDPSLETPPRRLPPVGQECSSTRSSASTRTSRTSEN